MLSSGTSRSLLFFSWFTQEHFTSPKSVFLLVNPLEETNKIARCSQVVVDLSFASFIVRVSIFVSFGSNSMSCSQSVATV